MTPELINSLAIQLLPLTIALAVAVYRIGVQYLPTSKQAHLKSLTDNLSSIAETVVSAVEQSQGSAPGEDKKAQAAIGIEAFLNAAGVKVDPKLISAAIDAAVYEMNLYQPGKPAVTVVAGQDAVQAATSNPVAQA